MDSSLPCLRMRASGERAVRSLGRLAAVVLLVWFGFAEIAAAQIFGDFAVPPPERAEPHPTGPAAPRHAPTRPVPARLRVQTEPSVSRVRIMNIGPSYRGGMELTPGRYDVQVSAPGYRTHRRWYRLESGEQTLRISLDRAPAVSVSDRKDSLKKAHSEVLIAGRYGIQGQNDEVVRDFTTGLEWQRCAVGQAWDGNKCAGKARTYTWKAAKQTGSQGWRLPSIDELATLVFCSTGNPVEWKTSRLPRKGCRGEFQQPTINSEAFPGTLFGYYWSSDNFSTLVHLGWAVWFGSGAVDGAGKQDDHFVRLVRTARNG